MSTLEKKKEKEEDEGETYPVCGLFSGQFSPTLGWDKHHSSPCRSLPEPEYLVLKGRLECSPPETMQTPTPHTHTDTQLATLFALAVTYTFIFQKNDPIPEQEMVSPNPSQRCPSGVLFWDSNLQIRFPSWTSHPKRREGKNIQTVRKTKEILLCSRNDWKLTPRWN